jgi:hypothetical protein
VAAGSFVLLILLHGAAGAIRRPAQDPIGRLGPEGRTR